MLLTNRQTDKQIHSTENTTSFAKKITLMEQWHVVRYNKANEMLAKCQIMAKIL